MKRGGLIFNNNSKGQTLLELIIAIGIFVTAVSTLSFFIFQSYVSGRLSGETIRADFLAQEGIEAGRTIRDNNFFDLASGFHGLAIVGNQWVFQGMEENIGEELNNGTRQIIVEDLSSDTKKITSKVNWQFALNRPEEVKISTYFTNWQKISLIEIRKPTASTDSSGRTSNDGRAYDANGENYATTRYGFTENPSILYRSWQLPIQNYSSLTLKYRYHADQASNNQYAVAYSIDGCQGSFIDLISLTSSGATDTTVSASLSADQDLSQVCLKIYSQRAGGNDNKNLYTHDVWTEGSY